MSAAAGHSTPSPTAVEVTPGHINEILTELRSLRRQVDRLTLALRRPERTKYSVNQAAERLALGRTKVYELMRSGKLAYVMEGRRRYVTEAACQAYERQAREESR